MDLQGGSTGVGGSTTACPARWLHAPSGQCSKHGAEQPARSSLGDCTRSRRRPGKRVANATSLLAGISGRGARAGRSCPIASRQPRLTRRKLATCRPHPGSLCNRPSSRRCARKSGGACQGLGPRCAICRGRQHAAGTVMGQQQRRRRRRRRQPTPRLGAAQAAATTPGRSQGASERTGRSGKHQEGRRAVTRRVSRRLSLWYVRQSQK